MVSRFFFKISCSDFFFCIRQFIFIVCFIVIIKFTLASLPFLGCFGFRFGRRSSFSASLSKCPFSLAFCGFVFFSNLCNCLSKILASVLTTIVIIVIIIIIVIVIIIVIIIVMTNRTTITGRLDQPVSLFFNLLLFPLAMVRVIFFFLLLNVGIRLLVCFCYPFSDFATAFEFHFIEFHFISLRSFSPLANFWKPFLLKLLICRATRLRLIELRFFSFLLAQSIVASQN